MIEFLYPLSDHEKKQRCVDCRWAKDRGEKTIRFKPKDPSSGSLMHQYACGHPDTAFAERQNEAGKVDHCEKWEAKA